MVYSVEVSTDDLFREIGRLQMELRARVVRENALVERIAALEGAAKEKKASPTT